MTEYDLTTILSPRQAKEKRRPDLPCGYEGCIRTQWARGYCGSHYHKVKNAGLIDNVRIKGDVRRRFYASFEVNPETLCWEWTASIRGGYGYLTIGAENKKVRAHRYSYELFYGPLPQGMKALHHCDVEKCCNVAHLYAGTSKDNSRDCLARGRHNGQLGTNKPKLSDAMVLNIRIMYARGGHSMRRLSDIYGVEKSTISGIIKGRTHL
jgi:hypothetical protein